MCVLGILKFFKKIFRTGIFFVGDVELELGSVGNVDTFPFLLGFKFRTGIVATYLFVGNGAKLQYKDMDVVRQRLMEVKI